MEAIETIKLFLSGLGIENQKGLTNLCAKVHSLENLKKDPPKTKFLRDECGFNTSQCRKIKRGLREQDASEKERDEEKYEEEKKLTEDEKKLIEDMKLFEEISEEEKRSKVESISEEEKSSVVESISEEEKDYKIAYLKEKKARKEEKNALIKASKEEKNALIKASKEEKKAYKEALKRAHDALSKSKKEIEVVTDNFLSEFSAQALSIHNRKRKRETQDDRVWKQSCLGKRK